jgi:hypothetical protein
MLDSIGSLEITRVNVTALPGKVTGIRWGARLSRTARRRGPNCCD